MMCDWFLGKPIQRQITALAIGPLILVTLLAILTQPLTLRDFESTSYAKATAIKIGMVVDQVRAAASDEQIGAILDAVSKTGMRAERVAVTELQGPSQRAIVDRDVSELIQENLPAGLEPVLRRQTSAGKPPNIVVVRVDRDTALAFAPALSAPDALINDTQVDRILMGVVVVLPVMLLSFYASRMITAPLTRFVDTAQSLKPEDGPGRPFEEGGPYEMAKLASSLNDMRSRVHDMLNDRTRMLRAISHDLRTPLTRLRLRAERSDQPSLRTAMMKDIMRIEEMIEETLAYLSMNVSAEEPIKADLPSLLQTVCADFADIGFSASYEGPDRFTYPCKPRALARAIANLVDNGTKFANKVVVQLVTEEADCMQIRVTDDGPGIAEELQKKVLEPFFKANVARTSADHGGFGLGLSIVHDIVRGHNGTMHLLNGAAGGLMVCLELPAAANQCWPDATTDRSVASPRPSQPLARSETRQIRRRAIWPFRAGPFFSPAAAISQDDPGIGAQKDARVVLPPPPEASGHNIL